MTDDFVSPGSSGSQLQFLQPLSELWADPVVLLILSHPVECHQMVLGGFRSKIKMLFTKQQYISGPFLETLEIQMFEFMQCLDVLIFGCVVILDVLKFECLNYLINGARDKYQVWLLDVIIFACLK